MLKMFRFGIFGATLPSERWRQVLAYTLTYMALEWILVHEAAHVAWGHIEMPAELRRAPWIGQLAKSQADDFATLRLLITLRVFGEEQNYEEAPWHEHWAHFAFSRKSDRINTVLAARLLSFALVGNESDDAFLQTSRLSDLCWKEYPPAAYRLWRAINLLTTPVRTNAGMPQLKPLDPQTDSIVPPSDLYSFVGGILSRISIRKNGPLTRLAPMHQPLLIEYDRILMDNLAPLAAYETDWRTRNLDPTRHPPGYPFRRPPGWPLP